MEDDIMMIAKVSPVTNQVNTMDLPITQSQYDAWLQHRGNTLIQHALPHLTDDQREFLISGCTKEDWDKLFPKE